MTSFKIFAGTDIGLRDNNEDNFLVCPNLSEDEWMVPTNHRGTIQLGDLGCLMVVADGMGGMNAGEVASDIAIKTVHKMFSPKKLPKVVSTDFIRAHIKRTIVEADLEIKRHCKKDPSTEGMGSTIVMSWLFRDTVFIGWMGDSRAYSYIPETGIRRLSKDHSYVQELVDSKMLTEEEAMFHPQSNIITRSLGDKTQKANPDVVCHTVKKGEIILLCSDGLCGVCADESIAEIMRQESDDLRRCKEALTNAALEAGGSDNITISILQLVDVSMQNHDSKDWLLLTWQNIIAILIALGLIIAIIFAGVNSCDLQKQSIVAPKNNSVGNGKEDAHRKKDVDNTNSQAHTLSTVPLPNKNFKKKTLKERIKDSSKNVGRYTKEEKGSIDPTPSDASPAPETTIKTDERYKSN